MQVSESEVAAQQVAVRHIEQERYDRQVAMQLARDAGADSSAIVDVELPSLPAGGTIRRDAAALLVLPILFVSFPPFATFLVCYLLRNLHVA